MGSFKNKIFLSFVMILVLQKSCNCNFTIEGKTGNQSEIISTPSIELSMKSLLNKINQRYFFGIDYGNNNNLQKFYKEIEKNKETLKQQSDLTTFEIIERLENNKIMVSFYDDIKYLQNSYNRFFPIVNNPLLPFHIKKPHISYITENESEYRQKLSSLIKKYVVGNPGFHSSHRVFDIIINNYKFKVSKNLDCDMTESLQTTIHNVYTRVVLVLIQNYALIKSVYRRISYHQLLLKSNEAKVSLWNKKLLRTRKHIKDDIYKITQEVYSKLANASRELRRCDPKKHEKYETYDRLTNFIQAWVGSMEYLNKENKCQTCSYEKTEFYEIDYFFQKTDRIHENFIPHGPLYNCTNFPDFNILYQSEPIDKERIYHHLAYQSRPTRRNGAPEKSWGNYRLENPNIELKKYTLNNIRHNYIPFFYPCDICLCYVDQNQIDNSIRRISLTPVIASSGAVVTGIRWIIKKKVLSLEIQEGLYKNGSIDLNQNLSWHGSSILHESQLLLSIDLRAFWLEDFTVPSTSLVAGVKFIVQENQIHLSLLGVEIDENGEFKSAQMQWYHPANHERGEELVIEKPDRSELAPLDVQHVVENKPDGRQFVKFQPTDLEKDAGQTTIPYLDIQRVVTNPPAPINGIGIYYKGSKGYGGFLALRLLSRNFTIKFNKTAIDDAFNNIDELVNSYNIQTS